MKTDEALSIAADVCKVFEGFHKFRKADGLAYPYICPAGYWTIGYGTLCNKDSKAITRSQAQTLLENHLRKELFNLLKYSPTLAEEQNNRVAALLSFVYNLGISRYRSSTLRRRVNEGDWDAVKIELQKWVYGGGKKLPGLVARRQYEARMI